MIGKLLEFISRFLGWLPPSLARLAVGITFAESGWGKLHSIPKVVEFFRELGIPQPELQAPFVATVEFVCGVALVAGLGTRVASVPLIGTMAVAILTAKRKDIENFGDLMGMTEFLLIVILVYLVVQGAGPLALDRFVGKKRKV